MPTRLNLKQHVESNKFYIKHVLSIKFWYKHVGLIKFSVFLTPQSSLLVSSLTKRLPSQILIVLEIYTETLGGSALIYD